MLKFSSSPAACTSGWLAMIRSTSVVPLRGMPMTKIGSSLRQPPGEAGAGRAWMSDSTIAASRAGA